MLSSAPLPADLALAAADAELGVFVAPLTPARRTSVLETLLGGSVAATAMSWWWLEPPSSWWSGAGLLVLALLGLVVMAVGLIGLAPGPGKLLLFEDGLVCRRPEGDVEVLRY